MNWTRTAIVGTAGSWNRTPWSDRTLTIASLNDAYRIPGFQRADVWFDFHPPQSWWTPPEGKPPMAKDVPPGHYARPAGHREWLGRQHCAVYLHPDYQSDPEMASWTHAQPFPKAEIEAHFGQYFTSSPAWIIALAVMQGVKELHIYGIHLATEFEYIQQRPNFEFLIGCVLGRGKRTLKERDGLRYYESADGLVVLPDASPVLQAPFQYAFQPRPDSKLEPVKWELHKVQIKRERTIKALKTARPAWPWTTVLEPSPDPKLPDVPRRVRTSTLQQDLWRYEALHADLVEQLQRAQMESLVSHA